MHLKVSDIERSLKFYRDLLGFELAKIEYPEKIEKYENKQES